MSKDNHKLWIEVATSLGNTLSKCVAKQVGAVILKNGSIISSGVNGTPSGFGNCNDYFFKDNGILYINKIRFDSDFKNTEFINNPYYIDPSKSRIDYSDIKSCIQTDNHVFTPLPIELKEFHHEWSMLFEIHAELNAILKAGKNGVNLENSEMYINYAPCMNCAKNIVVSGVKTVYYNQPYDDTDLVFDFLWSNGVELIRVK